MDSLPPIPTPAAQKWREFRIQAMPLMTFIVVLVGVVALWKNYVLPTNIVGEVEAIRANIISAVPGTIKELKVTRFQRVKKGEEIAVISTMNQESLQASLRTIEADLKLMRARMELDILRNSQGYEALRLDYLKERVELNLLRVTLRYQQSEAERLRTLFTNNPPLVTQTEYEAALSLAAVTATNIIESEIVLADKEKTLPALISTNQLANDVVEASIKAQEELLRAEGQTVSLKSPIDGMVSVVTFLEGQKVVANSPIAVISAVQPTRIVGYIRKPYTSVPKVGDTVQIRRQSFKREIVNSTVVEVSGQLEPIALTLVPPSTTAKIADLGLPFAVAIPAELALIPGEPIDLIFMKAR